VCGCEHVLETVGRSQRVAVVCDGVEADDGEVQRRADGPEHERQHAPLRGVWRGRVKTGGERRWQGQREVGTWGDGIEAKGSQGGGVCVINGRLRHGDGRPRTLLGSVVAVLLKLRSE
jgi:hypothetical protein